ncbi:MAG: hypothetical protein H0V18_13810 [Pyrinomonadaceae bacterium]|nr:hypothetical protein [Pyrinomonadaceae bacterium]
MSFKIIAWQGTGPKVHNVILLSGDGMGVAHRTAARIVSPGLNEGRHRNGMLEMDQMTNVFWMQNVVSKENPALRSVAELRSLYEEAGAQHGRSIVTYCRTGGQASHAYFTLKYLGYNVVMYDGSFFEWSNTEGAPIIAGEKRN